MTESTESIEELYLRALRTPSDINEHVGRLFELGQICSHITEFGVRRGVSTAAWVAARPATLVCYDLVRLPEVDVLEAVALDLRIDFAFHEASTLEVKIEPTDLLFIDTLHVYDQLRAELALHADKVSTFIVLHDTADGPPDELAGYWRAVTEFLRDNRAEWMLHEHRLNNNGLTTLRRRF